MATQKTDFSLSVNINPDTSRVQRTLDRQNFTIRTRLEVDTERMENAVNRMFQQTELTGFQKINTQIREGLTAYRNFGQATQETFTNVTRYTETFKNTLGEVYERVTTLTRGGRILESSLKKIQEGVVSINTETTSFTSTLNGVNTNVTRVTKTTTDTAGNIQQVVKETHEWTDANGRLHQTILTLNGDGVQIAPTLRTVDENVRNVGNDSEQSARQVSNLGRALSESFNRLVSYYVIDAPVRLFRQAVEEAITTVQEFDSALIEFKKVSDLTGESLTSYISKLAEMGKITGSTMQGMVEAATQFRKSGFNDEDSATLSSVAEMFRNVADNEISAADSASFIISQMKAFNIEAENSQHIIDAVNEVSNHFAVSSSDLSENLGKVSAALAVNGVKYEEMLGMMTAITEVTRNASTASRGLNMISSRLVQTLDESSSTGKKLTKIYNDLGISLKDQNGQMRGTYDILKDLAAQWNNLSGDQQKYIALTSAGARQTQNFVALMENFSQAIKATEMAYDSSGSAAEENARVMDSVAKKTEILRSEFQQLVIGKGGLQDFAKGLLDVGINALQLVNSLGGLPSILTVLTGLLIGINALNIYNGLRRVVGGIQNVIYAIPRAIGAWQLYLGQIEGVEAGTITLNQVMQSSIPVIGLIVTALSAVVAGIMAHNRSLEEQKQKIRESITAFSDEYNALENVQKRLQSENITREELNNIIDSNLDSYTAERLKLLDINKARQETIDLIEKEKKAKAEELIDTGLTEYEDTLKELEEGYEFAEDGVNDLISTFEALEHTSNKELDNLGKRFKEIGESTILATKGQGAERELEGLRRYKDLLIAERDKYDKSIKEEAKAWEYWDKAIRNVEPTITSVNEKFNVATEIVRKFENALKVLGIRYDKEAGRLENGADRWGETLEVQSKALNETNTQTKRTSEELSELKTKYNITDEAIEDYIETHREEAAGIQEATEALIDEAMAQEEVANTLDELSKVFKEAHEATKSLVSSIKNVGSALEEQNEQGSLSIDTQLELIDAGYALALTYDEETGACRINEEAVVDMTKAKLDAEIAALKVKQSALTDMLLEEASAATANAQAFLLRARAMGMSATSDYAKRQEERGGISSISGSGNNWGYVAETESRKMYDAYSKDIEALQNMLDDFGKNGAKTFSNLGKAAKSAGKSAKDSAKDLNKELEETKKQYETVIKWITKQYDKKIDAIKKSKDEATKAIEKEIKALEKEKDTILDNIEKETNALEKEKDARKKYWDDQIDALKKQNEALKDSLELQEKLDALEKAKNTRIKVYKEGQGFVYDVDQTAVAKAQKELDEYLSEKAYEDELERLEALRDAEIDNYEKRIDALNEYKDNVQASYEEQIDALKEHKEALEEQYDAEIELYENYKQQFEDMVNAYEENQNKLLAQQLTGIDFENDNWMTRLDNLAKFVNEYNKLQQQLNTGNTNVSADTNFKGGGNNGGGNKNAGNNVNPVKTSTPQYDSRGFQLNEGYTSNNGQISKAKTGYIPTEVAKKLGTSTKVYSYASGTSSVPADEIAVVGEKPNQEIVIGSKLNNGELMQLNKGTGIVNAQSSTTLAGMLNQVGKFGSSGFGSGNGTLNNNINNDSLVVNGVTIQGANIKDPETFVNGLLNMKAEAIQRAYRHR